MGCDTHDDLLAFHGVAELALSLSAAVDVTQGGDVQTHVTRGGGGEQHVDGHRRAAGPQQLYPGGRRGDERESEGLADELLGRAGEQFGGCRVAAQNEAAVVNGDDPVRVRDRSRCRGSG